MPRFSPREIIKPWAPACTSFGVTTSGRESTDISICNSRNSVELRFVKRGSPVAAAIAQSATTRSRGSCATTRPIHPRNRPFRCKVTNAPEGIARLPEGGSLRAGSRCINADSMASLAICSSERFSSLRSGDILRIFLLFQHQPQALPFFIPMVYLTPEHQEIMHRGYHRADDH